MRWWPRSWIGRLSVSGLALIVVLVAAWLVWAQIVIFHPRTATPAHADAIVVLGPYEDARANQALNLSQRLHVPQVVMSVGDTQGQRTAGFCADVRSDGHEGVSLTCFIPDPFNTRGEAEEIGRLASGHGWVDIIVVARQAQVSRAELLIRRCFSGTVQMVSADGSIGQGGLYDLMHQTGGFIEAALFRGC